VDTSLIRRFSIKRINQSGEERVVDIVAVEEPLAISVSYRFKNAQLTEDLAVTMRTPGHDRELAAGLLHSEGVIRSTADLVEVRALGGAPSNEVLAVLGSDVDFEGWRLSRNGFVSSSCGVCGKRSRDAITHDVPALPPDGLKVRKELIERLPSLLRGRQQGFAQTGGLHAAALVTTGGQVEAAFEDIGRHNALDKLIGWAVLNGLTPLSERLLLLSSRSSFELIQKAAMAGAPVMATVGGPSSLAIDTARDLNMTLIGFVRDGRFNIYSGEWRVNS
jgi:FdhD protein